MLEKDQIIYRFKFDFSSENVEVIKHSFQIVDVKFEEYRHF